MPERKKKKITNVPLKHYTSTHCSSNKERKLALTEHLCQALC